MFITQVSKKEQRKAIMAKHEEISLKACEVIQKSNGHLKSALCTPLLTPTKN